jgi:CHAT domain-containing protein
VETYLSEVRSKKSATNIGQQLFSLLLRPLSGAESKLRLIIVPDEKLNLLPFDSLTNPRAQYLLDSHIVSYAPSATVLYLIREAKRPHPAALTFLGIGAVPYQKSLASLAMNAKAGPWAHGLISDPFELNGNPLPDLPSTLDEVKGAGEIFGRSSVLLLGADATETAFKSEPLDRFRIIHIAVHAIASPKFPDRAALVLGGDPVASKNSITLRKMQLP